MRTIDRESIQNLFAGNIRKLLIEAGPDYEKLYEIRLRVGRPLFLVYAGGERFLQIKRGEPYFVTKVINWPISISFVTFAIIFSSFSQG